MPEEIELKLRLPRRAVKLLLAHPLLQDVETRRQRLHNTYFDTPDLTLKAAQIELRQRQSGHRLLQTVKSGDSMAGGLASRGEWEEPAAETGHFDFSNIDDKSLRECLETSRDDLQPLFTTEFSRISWQLHARSDSAIELALDRGVIESQGRQTPICEVELELKEGDPADLFELASQLQQTLPLHPSAAGKAARGYALWLDETAQPLKANAQVLSADMSPLDAFRTIALACLRHLQGNEEGAQATADEPEYIHQMRVAVRRLRSALKLFAPVLPPEFVEHWNALWRDLGGQLGQARNWDVFATQTLPPLAATFPELTEIRQLTKACTRQRSSCSKAVHSAITADDHSRLLLEFTAALYSPPFFENESFENEGPEDEELVNEKTTPGEEELSEFAARRLARLAKRTRKLARRVRELDESERHRMRIAFKKLRYALEFFAPLLPERRLKPYLKGLEKLQDALGELNDLAVAQRLIAGLSRVRTAGARTDGVTAGWLAARNDLLLCALPQKLDRFLDIKRPWR